MEKVRLTHSEVFAAVKEFHVAMHAADVEDFRDPDCSHLDEDVETVVVALLRAGWERPSDGR